MTPHGLSSTTWALFRASFDVMPDVTASLDFASEATLGLRLVGGLAEQLGGSVRRTPGHPSGIEIVFPAAR